MLAFVGVCSKANRHDAFCAMVFRNRNEEKREGMIYEKEREEKGIKRNWWGYREGGKKNWERKRDREQSYLFEVNGVCFKLSNYFGLTKCLMSRNKL